VKRLALWRIAAAVVILAVLGIFAVALGPVYYHNLQLQSFVGGLTQSVPEGTQSDDSLRAAVLDKARQLNLPVREDNVHVVHSSEGTRVDVRYFVRVTLPGYTVDLHFHPAK
jgi:hypothetical protein